MADDGGLAHLQKRLAAIPKDVVEAIQPAVLKQANVMAATMRRLVPVDQGDLKDSIHVTPGGGTTPPYSQPGGSMTVGSNSAAVTVGNVDVRYGHLVEYGHSGGGFSGVPAPAHPFFWPSVRLHNKRSMRAIKGAISRAIKKRGRA